jgi:hypothetical protein
VDDLLAATLLRAVRQSQDRFLQQLTASGDAAVAAGLALHDFAAQEPADARLLAALRREDLVGEVSDPALAVGCRKLTIDYRRRWPHWRAACMGVSPATRRGGPAAR